jgi:hypothetical protein
VQVTSWQVQELNTISFLHLETVVPSWTLICDIKAHWLVMAKEIRPSNTLEIGLGIVSSQQPMATINELEAQIAALHLDLC